MEAPLPEGWQVRLILARDFEIETAAFRKCIHDWNCSRWNRTFLELWPNRLGGFLMAADVRLTQESLDEWEVPYYFDTATRQTQWNHPCVSMPYIIVINHDSYKWWFYNHMIVINDDFYKSDRFLLETRCLCTRHDGFLYQQSVYVYLKNEGLYYMINGYTNDNVIFYCKGTTTTSKI